MTIFRCKMCGGDLEVVEGSSICTCDFCGTKQTIPTVQDDVLQTQFNRANVLRMKAEFDKAAEVYERILLRSESEAEAYWGLILCKYGIEYVEDPVSKKRIPTCHRTSYDAVTTDEDYKNALKYADLVQREIYESEAKAIDEIQKGILALAQKEEAYDVFICYKETDDNGKRTPDSVIANDIYHQLTMEGFKVFYSAISLEDKLGKEYEPYIFSALNTAKVMLAVGTRPEYFNAVWVKNEWSRFLKLMQKDRTRLLIPCYRDMDPYELPEEFAHLQAQNMSKIGFINDLVRGIKKVITKKPEKSAVPETIVSVRSTGKISAASQVERGNMALEDHEWSKAENFFEEALNLEPKCAEAYIGKLLVKTRKPVFASWIAMQKDKYKAADAERLEACPEDKVHIEQKVQEYKLEGYLDEETIRKEYIFDRGYDSSLPCRKKQKENQEAELASDRMLSRAKQYATGETKKGIDEGIAGIIHVLEERIEQAQEKDLESIDYVIKAYEAHITEADKKVDALNKKAKAKKEQAYQAAVWTAESAKDLREYEIARDMLKTFEGYKDSYNLADKCQREIERLNEEKRQQEELQKREKQAQEELQKRKKQLQEELHKKKNKLILKIVTATTVVLLLAVSVSKLVIVPNINNKKYETATELMKKGDYEAALTEFTALKDYKDSKEKAEECKKGSEYTTALEDMEKGDYEAALTEFTALKDYKDSEEKAAECKKGKDYTVALKNMEKGEYKAALLEFTALKDYKDSTQKAEECRERLYTSAMDKLKKGEYKAALTEFDALKDYKDSKEKAEECKKGFDYTTALERQKKGEYKEALTLFTALKDYKDSKEKAEECRTNMIKNASIGSIITFGNYEQDNNPDNGKEEIEWIVLDKKDKRLLVISNYALDCQPYNTEYADVTWETCSLRKWLNGAFMENAFDSSETAKILTTVVTAEKNPKSDTDPGNDTEDQVFLLSINEAEELMNEGSRMCGFTSYVKARGAYSDAGWWLRTLGYYDSGYAATVEHNGGIRGIGSRVDVDRQCVRPALWISPGA